MQNYKITNQQNSQRGYMMITLMLVLALVAIALAVALPDLRQQVKRDREEEMRHRGTAYMRAIQHFYKKLGRYPTKIEDLENTNNLRFLRKRYTDPMNVDPATGKERDFKLLHQQDITLNNGPVMGQAPGQTGFGQSGFGQGGFGQGGLSGQSGIGGIQGGLSGLQSGLNSLGAQTGSLDQLAAQVSNGDAANPSAGNPSGSSASGSSTNPDGTSNPSGSASSGTSGSSSGLSGQTFGGGPILGVASLSKAKTIRVFFTKDHYNDWLFIYVPQADRGGLLTGPVNPGMSTGNVGGINPAQMAAGATGQNGFGQNNSGSSFGQGSFGQGSLNGSQNQGFQTQTPQTPTPAPQQ